MRHHFPKLALLLSLALATQFIFAEQHAPTHAPSAPAAASPSADPQTDFSLEADREPVTSLDGQWRFQPGDDPRWASPTFDDSHWILVKSGSDWDELGYHNMNGVAWYRFHITLPPGEETYSLRLPVIYTSYELFADGKLLLTQGGLPPHAAAFRSRPAVVDLPDPMRPVPHSVTIAIRVWHDPLWSHYRHGGLQGAAEAGRGDLIHSMFETQEQAHLWQYSDDFDLGALQMLAFAIALVLFATRHSEREFLWFALLVLGQGGTHYIHAWGRLHTSNILLTEGLEALLQTVFLASALIFFRTLFKGKWSNAFVFALVCCGLNALTYPLRWMGALTVVQQNLFSLFLCLPVYGWIVLFIRHHANRRQLDARVVGFPIAFLFCAFIYSQVLWILQTTGYTVFSNFEANWRQPFYFTLGDVAETLFLIAMLVIVLRRFALRSREQDRVESELEAARSVQQVLVPESLPEIPGLLIGTAYHPAQEVGGDFFQILPLASGDTLIVIGDVAGKGLPAALQVSLAVGTLRALAERNSSPAEIMAGLNRSLQGRSAGFTTCLALHVSADRTVLTFANAGHIAPYVNGFELRTEPNLPLGLVPEIVFSEVRYTLSPGDHLTVLTDGVPEAMHHRELFGFERTGLVSRQNAEQIAEAACNFGQTDDITVLTIDIVALPASHTEQLEPALQPV